MGVTFWLETDVGRIYSVMRPNKSFCEAIGANIGDHEPDAELSGLAAMLGIELEPILLVTGETWELAELPEDMPEDERREILEEHAAYDEWATRCWQDARWFAAYLAEWDERLAPLLPPEPVADLRKVEYYPIGWSADLDRLGALVAAALERGATRLRMRAVY